VIALAIIAGADFGGGALVAGVAGFGALSTLGGLPSVLGLGTLGWFTNNHVYVSENIF
jgi:hypothetical protein